MLVETHLVERRNFLSQIISSDQYVSDPTNYRNQSAGTKLRRRKIAEYKHLADSLLTEFGTGIRFIYDSYF